MTERDIEILTHVSRYRLTIRQVLDRLFFPGGASSKNVLQRLLDEKRLQSRRFSSTGLSYYQLTLRQAREFSCPENRAKSFGAAALHENLAVLWHCLLNGRDLIRLENNEIEDQLGFPLQIPVVHDPRTNTLSLIHVPGSLTGDDYTASKFKRLSIRIAASEKSKQLLSDGKLDYAVLVETPERQASIDHYLSHAGFPTTPPILISLAPSPVTLQSFLATPPQNSTLTVIPAAKPPASYPLRFTSNPKPEELDDRGIHILRHVFHYRTSIPSIIKNRFLNGLSEDEKKLRLAQLAAPDDSLYLRSFSLDRGLARYELTPNGYSAIGEIPRHSLSALEENFALSVLWYCHYGTPQGKLLDEQNASRLLGVSRPGVFCLMSGLQKFIANISLVTSVSDVSDCLRETQANQDSDFQNPQIRSAVLAKSLRYVLLANTRDTMEAIHARIEDSSTPRLRNLIVRRVPGTSTFSRELHALFNLRKAKR